jgi:type I restriction enzyme S subunit
MRKGWKKVQLGKVCRALGGHSFKSDRFCSSGKKVLRISNITDGGVYFNDSSAHVPDGDVLGLERFKLKNGDLVIALSGATTGKMCVFTGKDDTYVNQRVGLVRVTNYAIADQDYINQLLSEKKEKILLYAYGGAQPNISTNDIEKFIIDLPPLPEQRKIAAILRTWDEVIEKLKKLKQHRKKLFNQRRRQLTDITSGHRVKFQLLSEISEEINRRNDEYDSPVMMISSTQGFIRQDANYDREMAGESLKKYIYLKEGEFAYNKGNSKTYPYGCIFQLEVPDALIPFVYICFKLDDKLNAGFFRHYFEAGSINRQLIRLISSSVRGNGLLNIDADDFFSCRIPVPDRSYQDTCANFLDAATKELTALDAEISFIKNQKRGLMQKLLTGAWRVEAEQEASSTNKKEKKHVG